LCRGGISEERFKTGGQVVAGRSKIFGQAQPSARRPMNLFECGARGIHLDVSDADIWPRADASSLTPQRFGSRRNHAAVRKWRFMRWTGCAGAYARAPARGRPRARARPPPRSEPGNRRFLPGTRRDRKATRRAARRASLRVVFPAPGGASTTRLRPRRSRSTFRAPVDGGRRVRRNTPAPSFRIKALPQ
jgi:hypothetical protein